MIHQTFRKGNLQLALEASEETLFGHVDDFHMCRLGMRFLAAREIPRFTIYSMDLALDDKKPECHCDCVVVDSTPESGAYRTHIHFLNIDPHLSHILDRLTRKHHLRCPHCANT